MLFYVRLMADGDAVSIPVNLNPQQDTVADIKKVIKARDPLFRVKNVLFAGKALADDQTIAACEISKECMVSVMGTKKPLEEEKAADPDLPPAMAPALQRQVTEEEFRYGDVLIVHLIQAAELKASDYWSGKSDPYCIFSIGNGVSARSSVVMKNLNPTWNETFGFLISSPNVKQTLTVMVWDHDFLSPDDPLGCVDIDLSVIPRDDPIRLEHRDEEKKMSEEKRAQEDAKKQDQDEKAHTKWYKLEGVSTGRVQLLLRRVALSSPQLADTLRALQKQGTCWTQRLLDKHKVSLKHFLGEVPWNTDGKEAKNPTKTRGLAMNLHQNPALLNLEKLAVRGDLLKTSNQRTIAKIANILWTQGAVFTQDLPRRYLWITNVKIPYAELYAVLQDASQGSLKSLTCFPNAGKGGGAPTLCGIATFKQVSHAVLVLLHLQNRLLLNGPQVDAEAKAAAAAAVIAQPAPIRRSSSSGSATGDEDEKQPLPFRSRLGETRSYYTGRAGSVLAVSYSDDDQDQPVHLGFAATPLFDDATQQFIHPFQSSLKVGVLSVAGPYPAQDSANMKTKDEGHTLEWGKFLFVLSKAGRLEGYARLQDYPDPGPSMSVDMKDPGSLLLTCGAWSVELVDTKHSVSYYLKAHNAETMAHWRSLVRGVKEKAERDEEMAAGEPEQPIMVCAICHERKSCGDFYLLDNQDGRKEAPACLHCLKLRIKQQVDASAPEAKDGQVPSAASRASSLLNQYSLQDLKDLGSDELFQAFLDKCTHEFIDAAKSRFLRCAKCDTAFEVEFHNWASKQPNLTKDVGLDNRPLGPEAQRHFLSNRFMCPKEDCKTTFCRLCKTVPYHIGFTCEEYVEFQKAPRCRFCTVAVMRKNRFKKPPTNAFKTVCDSEECAEKVGKSCTRVHDCGHPCGGVRGEEHCLPCLQEECLEKLRHQEEVKKQEEAKKAALREAAGAGDENKGGGGNGQSTSLVDSIKAGVNKLKDWLQPASAVGAAAAVAESVVVPVNTADELCSICYTEEVGLAPSILLKCGHVFHAHCLKGKLAARWPNHRVNFQFAGCPLCKEWMASPQLKEEMEPIKKLYDSVKEKILVRAELDEAEKDEEYVKRVLTEGSRYYKDPLAYGLHAYAYYLCKECKLPYFGGKRACEDGAAEEKVNPDELICFDCATVMSSRNCDKPGHSEFLLFKCRFCCSPAVWFCFGTTHFCEYCHSHWPPNRHPANEQCPPPGKTECPLGLPVGSHKNGEAQECEYVLGCGMCRNQLKKSVEDRSAEEAEVREKLKKLKEAKEAKEREEAAAKAPKPDDQAKGEEQAGPGALVIDDNLRAKILDNAKEVRFRLDDDMLIPVAPPLDPPPGWQPPADDEVKYEQGGQAALPPVPVPMQQPPANDQEAARRDLLREIREANYGRLERNNLPGLAAPLVRLPSNAPRLARLPS